MNAPELSYVFATNLQQKLKDKIYGKVFVKVIDDDIYIQSMLTILLE